MEKLLNLQQKAKRGALNLERQINKCSVENKAMVDLKTPKDWANFSKNVGGTTNAQTLKSSSSESESEVEGKEEELHESKTLEVEK